MTHLLSLVTSFLKNAECGCRADALQILVQIGHTNFTSLWTSRQKAIREWYAFCGSLVAYTSPVCLEIIHLFVWSITASIWPSRIAFARIPSVSSPLLRSTLQKISVQNDFMQFIAPLAFHKSTSGKSVAVEMKKSIPGNLERIDWSEFLFAIFHFYTNLHHQTMYALNPKEDSCSRKTHECLENPKSCQTWSICCKKNSLISQIIPLY